MKRAFDFIASLIALVVFGPLLVLLCLLIAVTSPGGAFYQQVRVGKDGKTFRMLKLRSMVADADQIGSFRTASGDPRITKIGRFIRKTSLDELPQLINVLKGEMSLVGPRPNLPAQESEYVPEQWIERNRVRPGLTGLAQAKARHVATPEERTNLDLEYVRSQSLGLDMKIIGLTLRQVLGKGSY